MPTPSEQDRQAHQSTTCWRIGFCVGAPKQKPRQRGSGAKFVGQQNGACLLSGWEECGSKPTDSTRQTHHRLHARTGRLTLGCTARGRSQKKPRRSGAKFLAGVCPSRGKANPPIHYHSWLRSGDFVERARGHNKQKPRQEAGLSCHVGHVLPYRACRSLPEDSKPTTPTPSRTVGFVTAPTRANRRLAGPRI